MKRISLSVWIPLIAFFAAGVSCQKENVYMDKPPLADAGTDQEIIMPTDSIYLNGLHSTDADGKLAGWKWTKISGPASFVIRNEFAPTTVVSKLDTGVYKFTLKVIDNKGLFAIDTVQVVVRDRFFNNHPPVANAGADRVISYPGNGVNLDGSGSTDPDNNITFYTWTKISGPPSCILADTGVAVTHAGNLELGTYRFELTVTDAGGLYSMDTMQVMVVEMESCSKDNRPQVNASLVPVGELSEPRSGLVIASAGDKIVFAGATLAQQRGTTVYGSSRVDIYDIAKGSWSIADLSESRSDIAVVAAGDRIFFAGGRLGDGAFDQLFSTVDIYNVTTNSWSVEHLTEKRAYIAAATVGNKVFFAGGEKDWNYNTSRTVDIYKLENGTWSLAYLSEPRSFISAVSVDNKIYFAGGHKEDRWYSDPSSRVDIYDNATDSWSVKELYRPMGGVGGIAVQGNIYWADACTVEIKDVNTWNSKIDHLSQPTGFNIDAGASPVEANGKIVFFRQYGENTDRFDIYDTNTKSWSVGVLPVKLQSASIISVKNVIYIAGGSVPDGFNRKVWRLDF